MTNHITGSTEEGKPLCFCLPRVCNVCKKAVCVCNVCKKAVCVCNVWYTAQEGSVCMQCVVHCTGRQCVYAMCGTLHRKAVCVLDTYVGYTPAKRDTRPIIFHGGGGGGGGGGAVLE